LKRFSMWLYILFLFIPALSNAWEGKVVGISDGDTIQVMHRGKAEKIRLYGVDCPESHQDFGEKAKQFMAAMAFGKVADVKSIDTDRYGRTVGVVDINGKTVNEELIKAGYAWFYNQYCKESFCSKWQMHQEDAKNKKIGLWSMKDPTPPWEFRRSGRDGAPQEIAGTSNTVGSYHGNASSMAFHRPSCKHFNCKNCTVIFETREEAISKGYHPCGMCRP
jgi:micrococcal nuclease